MSDIKKNDDHLLAFLTSTNNLPSKSLINNKPDIADKLKAV